MGGDENNMTIKGRMTTKQITQWDELTASLHQIAIDLQYRDTPKEEVLSELEYLQGLFYEVAESVKYKK